MRAGPEEPSLSKSVSADRNAAPVFAHGHDLLRLLGRLHRRYLDVVRIELERMGVDSIAPVQGVMLLSIGDGGLSLRDLVVQGYYLGANAASNMKALLEAGLIETQERADGDRRRTELHLTEAGRGLREQLRRVETAHIDSLAHGAQAADELWATYRTLRRLEQTWADVIRSDALDIG